jgi:hypothetical protein
LERLALPRGLPAQQLLKSSFCIRCLSELSQLSLKSLIIKVSGLTLATETLKLVEAGGFRDVLGYLESLELEYPDMIRNRRADEILDS